MFLGRNTIAHAMVQSAESLSLDAFASDKLAGDLGELDEDSSSQLLTALYGEFFTTQDGYFSTSENWKAGTNEEIEEVVKNRFLAYLVGSSPESFLGLGIGVNTGEYIKSNADKMLSFLKIENGVDGLDFSGSTVKDGVLTIKVKYRQKFVFDFNGLAAFDREETLDINLWSN